MLFNRCKLHQKDALTFISQYSVSWAGSGYAIRFFIYIKISSSNKTVWTGLNFIRISSCILAWWYPANTVQFAQSVTQTSSRYTCQKLQFNCCKLHQKDAITLLINIVLHKLAHVTLYNYFIFFKLSVQTKLFELVTD